MQIFAFDTVPSTMIVAQDIVQEFKGDMFCVLAKTQEAGIGTQGRQWESPIGNFYATFCFKNYEHELLTQSAIITGICVAQSLKKYGIDAQLKWTNDIIINDKKIGGILCDFLSGVLYIGIGINFKINPISDNKTSLLHSDKIDENLDIDYLEFAKILGISILDNLKILKSNGFEYFVDVWRSYAAFYNRYINVECPDSTIKTGIDKGINHKGFLCLETENGMEYLYSARIIKVV
jgi:BirA family biotin operon repressor/biotin-[acetyl-CoA-carboxylase] ligase